MIVPFPEMPDHLQLAESDGSIVENFLELPQNMLLTDSIAPVLRRLHPDGRYAIGHDSGIYWRYVADEPLKGCKAPDWFLLRDVEPTLDGEYRRSYVMWMEAIAPLILIEFVSGDGSEERDQTPGTGKFWVYERAIRAPYYAIYEVDPGQVEVHHLVDGLYVRMEPNERGHYPITPLGLELGIWNGQFMNLTFPWLRWWDAHGNLLPTGFEAAEEERQLKEQERQLKEQAESRAERLAARLRDLGIDPNAL